jgi:RNA polymerase sigma-70 factor (ECF subfamily)
VSTDQELVHRTLVLKDKFSYGRLVQKYQKEIRTYLLRLSRNKETADDLAQESFLTGFRNLAQLRDSGQYRAWMFRIAYHEFLQWLRRQKETATEDVEAHYENETLSAKAELNSLLKQIRDEERAAIILCLGHGFTHGEAAELLKVPEGTVKSLILRAREKIGVQNGSLSF